MSYRSFKHFRASKIAATWRYGRDQTPEVIGNQRTVLTRMLVLNPSYENLTIIFRYSRFSVKPSEYNLPCMYKYLRETH